MSPYTARPVTVIRDESTRAEIAVVLADACREAKRKPRIIERFTSDAPTAWSEAHALIGYLLDDYFAAPA